MEIVVLYAEGCPNRGLAESRVRQAAELLGCTVDLRSQMVESVAQSEMLGFRGSPTLLADGADLFPVDSSPSGTTCRLYLTEGGLEGAPSVAGLQEVMRRRCE